MEKIQKLLEQQLEKIPQQILQRLIEKKLCAAEVNPEPALVDRIVNHVLSNNPSSFQWDDGKDVDSAIELSISDEDITEVEGVISRLMESMPDIIDKTSTTAAKSTLKTLKRKWREEYFLQEVDFSIFRKNLERRWGRPLGMLRMLLTISREFGAEVAELRSSDESHLNNVLLRLHIRACQVTAEIITLLENGYADGAMARWRTLHEISIVMALMNEHGEQLAERYIAHRAVEAKSGKDQYELCYEQLGYQPLTADECNEIEKEFKDVISTYGKEFSGPYGWAAGYVQKGRRGIGLGELEAAAGRSAMASHYKFASHNVHAGPHALFFRLGLMDESGFLAGASNAGLTEPGQNTAVSLAFVSILLAKGCINLDTIILMKILLQLRGEIPQAFAKAEQKLRDDHARYNRKNKKKK
jgi:hypothetical protein